MIKPLTDEQWNSISNTVLGQPVELNQADPEAGFVYDREYGFFIADFGCHEIVMATLLAFKGGCDSYFDLAKQRDGAYPPDMRNAISNYSEEFIQLPGTCFLSSAGRKPQVWTTSNLNIAERRMFGKHGFSEIGR